MEGRIQREAAFTKDAIQAFRRAPFERREGFNLKHTLVWLAYSRKKGQYPEGDRRVSQGHRISFQILC